MNSTIMVSSLVGDGKVTMTISDLVQHLTLRPKDYFKDSNEIPYTDHSPSRLLKDEVDSIYLSYHLTPVNCGHTSFVPQNKHRLIRSFGHFRLSATFQFFRQFGLYGTTSHLIQTALRGSFHN